MTPSEGATKSEINESIGKAIQSYLDSAVISATMSKVSFPLAKTLPKEMIIPEPGEIAGTSFETNLQTAITKALSTSIGDCSGTPIPPGTKIVSEVGMPPIVPPIFIGKLQTKDQSLDQAAGSIADAIHKSVTSILFTVTVIVSSPAGPVPTPIPGVKIQ